MAGLRWIAREMAMGLLTIMTLACGGNANDSVASGEPNPAMASGGNGDSGASGGSTAGNGGSTAGNGGSGAGNGTGGEGGDATTSLSAADRCPGAVLVCTGGGVVCDLGECMLGECAPTDCEGPPPNATRIFCQDQTFGGPYCARDDSGTCSWDLRECPETNECDDGLLACTDGTATSLMPPDCNAYGHCQVFCERGTRYFVPGCGSADDTLLAEEGCYVECVVDDDCPDRSRCIEVVTNPCAFSRCAACGTSERVCIAE
jgi:hypothetical protein